MKKLIILLTLIFVTKLTYIKAEKKVDSVYVASDSISTKKVINQDSIWFMENIAKKDSIKVVNLDLRRLVYALIYVESRGNDKILNRSKTCVGCLQETKTLVRDVNRILKIWKINRTYVYDDRTNRIKSIEMFFIIVKYYKKSNWEELAKSWNQGPAGMYTYPQKAQAYWNLVKKALQKIK